MAPAACPEFVEGLHRFVAGPNSVTLLTRPEQFLIHN
jgi:hypothetical protein